MSTNSRSSSRFLLLALGYILILSVLAAGLLSLFKPGGTTTPAGLPEISSATIQPSQVILAETPAPITPSLAASPLPSVTVPPAPTLTGTPTSEVPVVFAVIGDFGSGNRNAADVAALVKSWQPDFIITTGDNNYPSGSQKTIDAAIGQFYHEYIFPYHGDYGQGADQNRFFPVLGNHDWQTANAKAYLDYFSLPGNERYYDFTWGPVHFFAVDGDPREPDGAGKKSAQAEWLREGLAASTAPWNIVYMHQPPYSSGTHGSVEWMRWPFAEWGASAVLAGHDHSYERLTIDGLPYFVNGLGGGAIYNLPNHHKGSQVRYNDDYGAMRVTASTTTLRFEFITRGGDLIDDYEMHR